MLKIKLHILIFILLTVLSQVGGIIYLVTFISFRKLNRLKRSTIFLVLYLLFTFLFIPIIAPYFGRVKIKDTKDLQAHNFITKLLNRNYVNQKLNNTLLNVSDKMSKTYAGTKVVYLDANFPFINKFPLLPHLSHNDGKKIDISYIYEDSKQKISNLKPSRSGYGVFEEPKTNEINQTNSCKKNGFWQYDFTKYFSFGKIHDNLRISTNATSHLIKLFTNSEHVSKVFIEPHLKNRMKLENNKIKFHGCRAVRHDDHIHLQIN